MAKGCAVVTTDVNHFSDIPSLKANSAEEIAKALDGIFSSKTSRANQIGVQKEYISDNSWERIAEKYISIFKDQSK
jgi:glycosyltransferase involved in cell wall biosynthesis